MTRRRGVTLVEVAIFGAVGLLVLMGAWSILYSSLRRGVHTETKVQGVQTALSASRRLEEDLQALHEDDEHPLVLHRTARGLLLRFHRLGPESAEAEWEALPLIPVSWFWDARSLRLYRREDGAGQIPLQGVFEAFEVTRDETGFALRYQLTSTSAEWLGRPEEERSPSGRTILRGAVPLHPAISERTFVHVNRVPYGD